ncbi:MAG: alginate export family protein [Pseudomonadales bacterium]|nr:alginate export family protein [Pseudomonadales bacterium]
MKKQFSTTISALSVAILAATVATQTQAEDVFYDALSGGKATLDARLRYEGVDQDGKNEKASGLTLRTRLGYKTAELANTTAFIEMDDVRVVGGIDDYSQPGMPSDYPVIADPALTELNQAYLSFKPLEGLDVIGGRQRLILDNARFVGNVGWRQHEQTYDALTVKFKAEALDATVMYSGRINTVTAGHVKAKDLIINVAYTLTDIGKISTYFYGLDNDAGSTLDTFGVRFSGKSMLSDDASLLYRAEFALQETHADAEASYLLAELGYGQNNWSVLAGLEILGSDDGAYGFQTPLATKHAFNGWADKFLATPTDGLEDLYIKGIVKAAGMKFVLIAHDFSGSDSGDDLGSEIDFLVVKPIAKKYKVGLKYAGYSQGDLLSKTDTTKVWLWAEVKF